jgi:predicted nucleotidyltransferase
MRLEEALRVLAEHRPEIEGYGVRSLSIFGSVARNEARSDSDVDVLVEFAVPTGYFGLLRLKDYLESLLGCSVDLATPGALRETMKEQILREAVHAA